MDEVQADIESNILDVTSIDLEVLPELENPILQASIIRILREADQPDEALSGFNSSI
jgi:FXSXX-COOH protein